MAAPLTAGELAAPLKTRRDEEAAAAQEAEPKPAAVAAAATAAARILMNLFAVAEHGDLEVQFRWVRRCVIQVADDPSSALFDSVLVEGVKAMTQDRRGKVSLVLPNSRELARILNSIERDVAPAVLVMPEGLTRRGGTGCTWHRCRAPRGPGARQRRSPNPDYAEVLLLLGTRGLRRLSSAAKGVACRDGESWLSKRLQRADGPEPRTGGQDESLAWR